MTEKKNCQSNFLTDWRKINMVGIYKYENGLKFTGMIASNREKAEKFLSEKYGYIDEVYGGRDENGKIKWEKNFNRGITRTLLKFWN